MSTNATVKADKICSACPRGQHQPREDQPTCVACELSVTWQNETNQKGCKQVSVCGAGSFVSTKATAMSDKMCSACPRGQHQPREDQPGCLACELSVTWQDKTNQKECKQASVCGAGSFVATNSTATADKVCSTCPLGQYQHVEDQPQCIPWRSCPAGTASTASGTSSTDRQCTACANNTFQPASNEADACLDATVCRTGTYVTTAATPTSDRECGSCALGETFTATNNLLVCQLAQACGTVPERAPPTLSSDRVCCENFYLPSGVCVDACPAGHARRASEFLCEQCDGVEGFSSTSGSAECNPVGFCGAGQVLTASSTSSSDIQCSSCPVGRYTNLDKHRTTACQQCDGVERFSSTPGSAECKPVGFCGAGQAVATNSTPSSDIQCSSCPAGRYSNLAKHRMSACGMKCTVGYVGASCSQCAATHQRYPGSKECLQRSSVKECAPGEFTDQSNEGVCTPCPVNTYSTGERLMLACTACPAYTKSPTGSISKGQCVEVSRELNTTEIVEKGYCTGQHMGIDGTDIDFKPIDGKAGCESFVSLHNARRLPSAPPYVFEPNPPACADVASPQQCRGLFQNKQCDNEDVRVVVGGLSYKTAAACRLSCQKCNTKGSSQPAPFGCVVEHGSSSSSGGGGGGVNVSYLLPWKVRLYDQIARLKYEGVAYTAVCEPQFCTEPLQEVVEQATDMEPEPSCGYGEEARDAWASGMKDQYFIFYVAALSTVSALACLAYACSCGIAPRSEAARKMKIFSVRCTQPETFLLFPLHSLWDWRCVPFARLCDGLGFLRHQHPRSQLQAK